MRVGFGLFRSRSGWWRFRRLSLYDLQDWRSDDWSERGRIVFVPTPRVLAAPLGVIVVVTLLLGGPGWIWGGPWSLWSSRDSAAAAPDESAQEAEVAERRSERVSRRDRGQQEDLERARESSERLLGELREKLPPDEWQRIQAELARKQQERTRKTAAVRARLEWYHRVVQVVYWIYYVALAELGMQFGVLRLLQFPRCRRTIYCAPRSELVVETTGLFGSTADRWPVKDLDHITWTVRKHESRDAPARWSWTALVVPVESDRPPIEFTLDEQASPPRDPSAPAPRLERFVERLAEITGLEIRAPVVWTDPQGRRHTGRRAGRRTERIAETVRQETYRSLDEMPPELRQRVEMLMRGKESPAEHSEDTFRVTVSDSDGTERTYDSLDEVPPKLRERIERLRRKRRG